MGSGQGADHTVVGLTRLPAVPPTLLRGEFRAMHPLEITVQTQAGLPSLPLTGESRFVSCIELVSWWTGDGGPGCAKGGTRMEGGRPSPHLPWEVLPLPCSRGPPSNHHNLIGPCSHSFPLEATVPVSTPHSPSHAMMHGPGMWTQGRQVNSAFTQMYLVCIPGRRELPRPPPYSPVTGST